MAENWWRRYYVEALVDCKRANALPGRAWPAPTASGGFRAGRPSPGHQVGSVDGIKVPAFESYSYGASKAAVHMLTRHLAERLAPQVLVNAIAPGPFRTDMMEFAFHTYGDAITTPLGRVGRVADIGGAVIYLAWRASSFTTGAVLPVDGGLSTVS